MAEEPPTRFDIAGLVALVALVVGYGVLVEMRSAYMTTRHTDLGVYLRAAWAVRAGEDRTVDRNSTEGRLLTEYEGKLDTFHKTLPLWSQPRPEARFALLAAFDLLNAVAPLGLATSLPRPFPVQRIKWLHDSLMYALQFFWRAEPRSSVGTPVTPALLEDGFSFLRHCMAYSQLADFHIGHGRGLHTLEVDAATRRVRFVPNPATGAAPDPLGILEEYHKGWDQVAQVKATLPLGRTAIKVLLQVPHHFESGRVVIDDVAPLKSPIIDQVVALSIPAPEIPLGDGCDLIGITAGEFRSLWLALVKWSMAATIIYLNAWRAGMEQRDHLPTQLVKRTELVSGLGRIADVPEAAVEAFVQRLTFGHLCPKKPDVFLQPLLFDGEWVAWSALLVQCCNYERNHLKLMARIPALKPTADNLIGARELVLNREIGALLSRHGFQFKTRIPLPDGVGEIDVLAFHDKHPSEILVIESKGVLEVDEVNEVNSATDELINGQEQLRKVVGVLRGLSTEGRARLWSKPTWPHITDYLGVVLTPTAQPNGRYDHREYPALSFGTVQTHYRPKDFRSPRRFWDVAVRKPWLRTFANCAFEYFPVRVGDVTYELPAGATPGDSHGRENTPRSA